MSLAAGTRLGPYSAVGLIGAGGMGEVYRAHDPRLGRDVAIKLLPAAFLADPDRLRRFEQEARAAGALNHPNILTVHEISTHDGQPYIVSELLEGETLREKLRTGAVNPRKAVDYGVQISHGLAAAHGKGIVHRDLKPENVFVTRDGRVKILDFGLARLCRDSGDETKVNEYPTKTGTVPGLLIGTLAYMSPEQARGQPADARSDVFALGAVLSEMLTGQPLFLRTSPAETLSAILSHDPAEASLSNDASLPAGLLQIVRRCLEKNPEERFQSTSDLGFALSNLSGSSSGAALGPLPPRQSHRLFLPVVIGLAALTLPLLGYLVGTHLSERPIPSFQKLTFRRGQNWGARFAPDGQTIVYSAVWEGGPLRLFSTRVDSPESMMMDVADANVLAISSIGELAVTLRPRVPGFPLYSHGTLARVPLVGGAPREILENVQGADWSPDGKEIAVTRSVNGRTRLEFPISRIVYETDAVVLSPRVSPSGDAVAFVESDPARGDEYRAVSIVDHAGQKRVLTTGWRWLNSLAWSSTGGEIWFAASQAGPHSSLWAVTRSSKVRLLTRLPAFAVINDISSAGRALVTLSDNLGGVMGLLAGESRERDLSWFDLSWASDLSPDGRVLVGTESGEGVKQKRVIYLRQTDGASPPIRLGDGFALALSPDSKWVLSRAQDKATQLELLPTGPGDSKVLSDGDIEYDGPAAWAAGGSRILVTGAQHGRPSRSFVLDLDGRSRAVTPEGVVATAISPDGQRVAALDPSGKILLYRVGGGDPDIASGPTENGDIGPWSPDGRAVFVSVADGVNMHIFRRDLATGQRNSVRDFAVADPAGLTFASPIISADGRTCVYNFRRSLSHLFLVNGLR